MLRLTALLLVLALPGRALASDDWLGPDKALHFTASLTLAQASYGASAFVFERPRDRVFAAAGFTLSLGVGKELVDLVGHGDPSWKDLGWDLAGAAVGLAIALALDEIFDHGMRAARH